MDLSNKSLALLLVAAIVLSFAGTLVSLDKLNKGITGLVSGTGRVNLSITSQAACTVMTNVSFGSSSAPGSTLSISTDTANFGTFQDCSTGTTCSGLTLNNTGNTNLSVTFNSSANASLFLNSIAVDQYFNYTFRNGTTTGSNAGCYVGGNTSGIVEYFNARNICNKLGHESFITGQTALTMEFNVTLFPTVSQGLKNAIITFDCISADP